MKPKIRNKSKVIGITTAAIMVIASAAFYYRNIQIEKAKIEEAKLDFERKEVSERMREGGRLLAEQLRKNPIVMPKDPLAPEDKTDSEDIAQIKLWHATPPKDREKLRPSQSQ